MSDTTKPLEPKIKKEQGPIRWEAILPFTIIVLLLLLYFKLFFDYNLRKGLEYAGYIVAGAEVDIAELETSFIKASIRIQGIEVTDAAKPTQNSISIGDVRFGMLWDALLRGKVVIKEVVVEKVEFGKPRKSPGKVKPPEPVVINEDSDQPSALQNKAEKLKDKALSATESKYNNNVLGDIAGMLGGTDSKDQLEKIEGTILSKEMAAKLEAEMKSKSQAWEERLKKLPQAKDFLALSDRAGKIKTKDFKSPDELQTSLKEFDSVTKEADAKYKEIQTTSTDLNQDLQNSQKQIKDLETQINLDIKNLESRFKIPKIDPKSLSQALFHKYLDPYLAKFNHYKKLSEKYVPPNLMDKTKTNEADITMQPRPREKGIVYEFGQANSYPAFWIQHVAVSSQAGLSPYAGNIKGEINDITSNQALIGKPTVALFAGDFPSAQLKDIDSKLVIDNRKQDSMITFDFSLGSFPIAGRELINTNDVEIAFAKASGQMKLHSELEALKKFKLDLDNNFSQVEYDIKAKNEIVDQTLKAIFAGIPVVTLEAIGFGELPALTLNMNSNLGTELSKGIEKQIQIKINEAREKVQKYVNEQVGQQKAQIEAQYSQIKGQVEKELKKMQDQANAHKKMVESKVDAAKKDGENQGKKKAEDAVKNAADELKKKMGW